MLGLRKSFGSASKKFSRKNSSASSVHSDNKSIDDDTRPSPSAAPASPSPAPASPSPAPASPSPAVASPSPVAASPSRVVVSPSPAAASPSPAAASPSPAAASPSPAAMDTVRAGLKESISSMSVPTKPVRGNEVMTASVTSVGSASDSEQTVSAKEDVVSKNTTVSRKQTSSSFFRINRVTDIYRTIRRNIFQLDDYTYTEQYFDRLNIDSYRKYIANERLIRMPRRGSNWDRALRAALMFGENLVEFGDAIQGFCSDTNEASVTALASCKMLLEIEGNSNALVPTFQALRELALLVGQVVQIEGLSTASKDVKHATADLYIDLIRLVGDIAVLYKKKLGDLSKGHATTVKFDVEFGQQINHIWELKAKIVDRMWQLKLGKDSDGVESIRQKLNGRHSVHSSFYSQITNNMRRAEDTCEWLKSYLIDFLGSDEKTFTITGPSGSGKTMLARWVKERLQRPLADEDYFTLYYTFPFDSAEDASCVAFLKNILFQLLELNVGDVDLYEKLVATFTEHSKTREQQNLEGSLWEALDVGLRTLDSHGRQLVILVDALEEVTGTSPLAFHKTLREHIAKFEGIRAITFSKHISHISQGCKHLLITQKYIVDDIRSFLRQFLGGVPAFTIHTGVTEDRILQELTEKAKDSFLWANLVANLLSKETSGESLLKTVQSLTSDLNDVVDKLVAKLPLKTGPARRLLSFMLVAHRPLTVGEVTELLRVDLEKKQLGPATDVFHDFPHLCGSLAVIRDGMAHFKNKAVREHMLGLLGKALPSPHEAQTQMTMSLLLYAKLNLDMTYEPTFEELSYGVVDDVFASSPLLQYAVGNWIFHFQSSGMWGSDGQITLSAGFNEIFPDSAFFALLERSCWATDTKDLIERYEMALKIREGCFHDKGVSVLQTLIILSNLYLSRSDTEGGAKYLYRAATVSQLVLSRSSTVTIICTQKFLQVTETMVFTSRTELVTWRIQMIEFMIEETKRTKGAHSYAVVRWYELLAKLYVSIHEHDNATLTYKLIYEIIVIIEGKNSPRARKVAETFGGLDITLKGKEKTREIQELEDILLESGDREVVESSSIEIRLRLALVYIAQKKWMLAEEIFITLWRSISIQCRIKASLELHMAKIRIAIEYVKFLRELKRIEEALSILTCMWAEYEHYVFEEFTLVLRIKELGMLFKSFGLLEVAVSIFAKVWAWFKGKGKESHEEAVTTTVLITEVVEEITTTTIKTKTITITTTEVTETVTREIYETHYHRCKKSGKADDAFFRSCFSLIKLYQSLENWVQCSIIIEQSLEITWKAILTADVNIKLSETHVTESIRIATSLAICYHRMRQFEKAEHIYLRIFRTCFGSLDLDHVCAKESLANLVAFYEEHHRHEKVIEIYIEVLGRYRKHFGAAHARTIELLYLLASQCRMLGRKDEFTYYIEIVTVLNKGRKHCHPDARKAAVLLIEYYYERKSWSELQHLGSLLWETFIHHHHECHFEEHEIEIIYKRYLYVLEFHAKVEYSVLYKLSKEYHTHVLVVFGATAAIVIKAMIAFGGICERHQEHYHEAVTIYEEVIKKTTTTKTTTITITETEITTVKTRLSKVYVTIITSGGKTTTTTYEKAIQVCLEVYASFKLEYGCWHETTLGKLREIIIIYKAMATHESRTKMIEILQEAFVSILSVSISSVKLFAAATTLASIYVTAGLVEYAEKLIQDVQHLVIFGNAFTSKEITLKFDVKLTKVAFVFLTGFKLRLLEKTVWTYSEVMASLLLEMSLYEQYTHALDSKSSIEVILEHGAKLRFFWEEAKLVHYEHLIATLDQKLFALFKSNFSAYLHAEDAVTHEFYIALLAELGRTRTKVDFAALSCKAGNVRVAQLLEKGEFGRAHEVARCAFHFAEKQKFYYNIHRVQYGYKLAEYMAGIDVRRPTDGKLHEEMLKTSREIMATVLEVFKQDGIDFVRLKFADLAGIVRLLGAQGNYKELEQILRTLWNSREVKEWTSPHVFSIGRLLVHVYYANGKLGPAIEMCDRLAYNLQRSKGYLHPDALEMSRLLASLYATGLPSDPKTRRPDKAMSVYEEVLRQIDAACGSSATSSPRHANRASGGMFRRSVGHRPAAAGTTDPKVLAATASQQFELLKRAYLRLGTWTKPVKEFQDLHARLAERLGKGNLAVPGPETWKGGEKADGLGTYVPPQDWRLEDGEGVGQVNGNNGSVSGFGSNGTVGATMVKV